MDAKKPWQSKTLWVNLVMAVAAFFPQVQEIAKESPEMIALFFAGVNAILRMVTKGKIELKDEVKSEPPK